MKVWERWDRVRAMDDPTGYLYRTAMNAFRSRVRRALTAARRAVTMGEQHDDFARIDERDAMARALGRLSRRQRAAMVVPRTGRERLGYR